MDKFFIDNGQCYKWIWRMLGMTPDAGSFYAIELLPINAFSNNYCVRVSKLLSAHERPRTLQSPENTKVITDLSASRYIVLRSLCNNRKSSSWKPSDGGAFVISNESKTAFLLTQKDDLHPNPKCRGKYSLISGSTDDVETLLESSERELYEEINDVQIADLIVKFVTKFRVETLTSVQWPGVYRLGWNVSSVPDAQFDHIANVWKPGVLDEANPVVLTSDSLKQLISQEEAEPGRHFVGSHHLPIKDVIDGK